MGKFARDKPARLKEKLIQIRTLLELSQNGMLEQLGLGDRRGRSTVSDFERRGDPPLPVLLQYARLAGVCLEVLVDDELDLPPSLPAPGHHYRPPRPPTKRKTSGGKLAG